ncbi:MAG: glutamate cyclase domain-containing protein [bacterium]
MSNKVAKPCQVKLAQMGQARDPRIGAGSTKLRPVLLFMEGKRDRMKHLLGFRAGEGMRATIASIENLIAQDPGHRNILPLIQRDHLRLAAMSLLGARRVLITSGFPILKARAGETDGPPGALAIGQALTRLGIQVAYITDRHHEHLFRAIGAEPLIPFEADLLEDQSFSHLVAVERPGRARDGRYYNMRGEEITDLVEPVDQLFLDAELSRTLTIGIGDGGNEIGMGRVFRGVARSIENGAKIASTVPTDYVVVSGVSNWGAYGLVGALSVLSKKDLLPSGGEIQDTVLRLLKAGAVDGLSGESELKVDGLPLENTLELVEEIRFQLKPAPLSRVEGLEVGVVGAGRSGKAVSRLLLSRGAKVRISEQARITIPQDLRDCRWELGGHSLKFMEGVELVVRSPGVDPKLPLIKGLRQRAVPVVSELEASYQLGEPRLVAVTGSFGKRSTIELLGKIMARCSRPMALGGNKGSPLSELLLENPQRWMALAVSSFQLESILRFRPRVAAILNIRPLHLDRHLDPTETVRIKSRIFMNQRAEDLLILNREDPRLMPLAEKHWGETLWVSSREPVDRGAWMEQNEIFLAPEGEVVERITLDREVFPENLLTALLAAWAVGISPCEIREAVEKRGFFSDEGADLRA